jgi:hypothetical protein
MKDNLLNLPFLKQKKKKKTLYIKIKDENPSIKNTKQMKAQGDTAQRKNENKQ